MSDSQILDVLLGGVAVGELRAESHGRTTFRFSTEYLESYPRLVLSQSFLDDPSAVYEGKHFALPSYFSNLLPDPEGKLRALVAQQVGVKPNREFHLLAALGEDLSGAVVVRPRGALRAPHESGSINKRTPAQELRFSLAGVQLKFSMVRRGNVLTYPVGGKDGDVIVKLPDPEIPHVPENEFSMMLWARACGIDVPEVELVPEKRVKGLPPEISQSSGPVFAIQRFDRPRGEGRVHIEDMCQVFGLMPDEKYEQKHYQHIGRLLMVLPDPQGVDQLLRRLVFMVASGNSDAHLKNWSLIYRDGVRAELAPAYDLVSTQVYERFRADKFALEIGRTRYYREISSSTFYRLAAKVGGDPAVAERFVSEMANRVRDEWAKLRRDLPIPEDFKRAIEQHWQQVPLLRAKPSAPIPT